MTYKNKFLSLLMCVCVSGYVAGIIQPATSFADTVSDAQAHLNNAHAQLEQLKSDHDKATEQLNVLTARINDVSDTVSEAQSNVYAGRLKLEHILVCDYKNGALDWLSVLMGSHSLAELEKNIHYMQEYQRLRAEQIAAQKEREAYFDTILTQLNYVKDEQQKREQEIEANERHAAQIVKDAQTMLDEAIAKAKQAEQERLAQLKKEADALAQSQSSSTSQEGPASSPSDTAVSTSSNADGSLERGWYTGAASAYGTKTDGTLGAHTATGAVVDVSSMGVAIPLSWNNARSYLGRKVEISYQGKTVIATINDLGSMGGGSRALDLQPGVWRALGAYSAYHWGVRTVSYRIL